MNGLLKEINCSKVPHRFIIKLGVPLKELITVAKEEQAEMVVMDTKGRGNISGLLTGSQADKMFRYWTVPLISIREK